MINALSRRCSQRPKPPLQGCRLGIEKFILMAKLKNELTSLAPYQIAASPGTHGEATAGIRHTLEEKEQE